MNHQDMKILVVLSVVGAIAVAGLTVVPTMVQSALAVQSSSAAGGAASRNDEEIATTGAASSASSSRNTQAVGGFIALCSNSAAGAGACSETGTP